MTNSETTSQRAKRRQNETICTRKQPRPFRYRKKFEKIYRFEIALQGIEPSIWRRIEVPDRYTFWDLHCAITDAFGWLDYHLHQFEIRWPESGEKDIIGIPDDEGFDDLEVLPGWNLSIVEYFSMEDNSICDYKYDFGDGWHHAVILEAIALREEGVRYPRCIGGERACPPEDVGGEWGYQKFLKSISYMNAPDHDELLQWVGGWFDPEWFDPSFVRFENPDLRWKIAFQDEAMPEDMRKVQYHMMRGDS